jgi:hypothetical protein
MKGFTRDKKFIPINNTRKKKKCVGDACKIQSEKQFDKNLGVVLKKFDKTRKASDEENAQTFEQEFDKQAVVLESALDKRAGVLEKKFDKGANQLGSIAERAVDSLI